MNFGMLIHRVTGLVDNSWEKIYRDKALNLLRLMR